MGLLKGTITARRYVVSGEPPDDFRDRYARALQEHAFREPVGGVGTEEASGWCLVRNLLDTDFSVLNDWLFDHYVVAALRTDRKTVPANLLRAHVDRRVAEWCEARGRAHAPAAVRREIREEIEQEMLARALPRVQVVEWVWDVNGGWALFLSTARAANDRFRTLFRRTFGLEITPFSPLDFLVDEPELVLRLESVGLSDLSGEAP